MADFSRWSRKPTYCHYLLGQRHPANTMGARLRHSEFGELVECSFEVPCRVVPGSRLVRRTSWQSCKMRLESLNVYHYSTAEFCVVSERWRVLLIQVPGNPGFRPFRSELLEDCSSICVTWKGTSLEKWQCIGFFGATVRTGRIARKRLHVLPRSALLSGCLQVPDAKGSTEDHDVRGCSIARSFFMT